MGDVRNVYVRVWGILGCIVLVLAATLQVTSAQSTQSTHGCAPLSPPIVSGTPLPPPATQGLVFLNEVLLTPHSHWNCSESATDPISNDAWVEIYNAQDRPFDLYAAHASIDSGPNTNAFSLPLGATVASHGYLVVFPRLDIAFAHTESAHLRLLVAGLAIDTVDVPPLLPDQSYARFPDGASTWQITTSPTIGTSNMLIRPSPTATIHEIARARIKRAVATARTPVSTSNKGVAGTTTTMGNGDRPHVLVPGVQPNWQTLQVPLSATPSPSTLAPQPTSTPPSTLQTMDRVHQVVLTLLGLALALALYWCWRLFKTP